MQKFFLLLILFAGAAYGQDTLILISGRTIVVSSVSLNDNTIAYRKIKPGSKLRTISPERVFSVMYRDSNEKVIYQPDSLDPVDFKVDEMRNFIKGEREARRIYKSPVAGAVGIAVGAGSAITLGFYGLVGPPLYSTVVQQLPVNADHILRRHSNGNPIQNISDNAYREGFEKRVREYRVRSAWIGGLIGFLVTSATIIIAN
jgi:hypothetical protein